MIIPSLYKSENGILPSIAFHGVTRASTGKVDRLFRPCVTQLQGLGNQRWRVFTAVVLPLAAYFL